MTVRPIFPHSSRTSCPHCGGTGLGRDDVAIGQHFRSLRIYFGLLQRQVAHDLNWSPELISHLEYGRRRWTNERIAQFVDYYQRVVRARDE